MGEEPHAPSVVGRGRPAGARLTGPLRRFLHLEKERPQGVPAPRASGARERFEAVEPAAPGGCLPAAGAPAPGAPCDEGSGLALDPADGEEQPFVRCPACGRDGERHAVTCGGCGAALAGEGVRRYNAELWRSHGEAARAEQRLSAEREETRRRTEAVEAQARLALAEALAAQILERERARSRRPWLLRALAWMARVMSARIDPPP